VDFETKMSALKYYNSVIDKWIEMKEISKKYGVVKVKDEDVSVFEGLTHANTDGAKDII